MRTTTRVVMMGMLTAGIGLMMMGAANVADGDEPTNLCSIQDWRYWHVEDRSRLYIEGRTTCKSGGVSIFAYTGPADMRQFIGGDKASISDYLFKASMKPVQTDPEGLVIEYIIWE